jgi:hypothetical protein
MNTNRLEKVKDKYKAHYAEFEDADDDGTNISEFKKRDRQSFKDEAEAATVSQNVVAQVTPEEEEELSRVLNETENGENRGESMEIEEKDVAMEDVNDKEDVKDSSEKLDNIVGDWIDRL